MKIPLFIIAIAGLLVAGYLSITYLTGGQIVCVTGGCEVARTSAYAQFAGIPTPVYGMIFYFLLALGALLWQYPKRTWVDWCLYILTASGLVVSAGLTYVEAFVINAWCHWCVISAILATAAFILVWLVSPIYGRNPRN